MPDKSSQILSQQTVFVLVHTNDMLLPSGFEIPLESKKSFSNNPLVYNKSLWSSVVECCLEYVRIVYDLFSNERMTSLVIVGAKEKICISSNDNTHYSWRHWMKTLSEVGSPPNAVSSLMSNSPPGLSSVKSILEAENMSGLSNGGRVIIFGYKMGENTTHWVDAINAAFNNEGMSDNKNAVTMSEWYLIDVEPVMEGLQTEEGVQSVLAATSRAGGHALFKQTSCANKDLHRTLMALCERHHHLACTLVQNIPMKEDTSNTQSAMYGVELIHPRSALDYISQVGLLPLMTMTHRPYCGFSSCIGIRWVTPKQSHEIEYYNTKTVHRVTTADVCHRASCCLATFVLEGRCVVLEIDPGLVPPAPLGLPDFQQELLLLTSHCGVLHLHSFSGHRDPVFEATQRLPCLSTRATKKVSSKLRTAEFNHLLLANRLVPATSAGQAVDRAFKEVEQQTRYWPDLSSDTLIFNKALMPKIGDILLRKHLDINEKSSCIGFLQQMIFDQTNAEKTATKKTQESKIFKTELEILLWLHHNRSSAHKDVLDSFEVFSSSLPGLVDVSNLLKCGEPINTQTGLTKLDRLLANGGAILREILRPTDRQISDALAKRSNANRRPYSRPEPGSLTLREVINMAMESSTAQKRKKFDGELNAVNNVTELYVQTITQTTATDPRRDTIL